MRGNKTQDGIRLNDILQIAREIGIEVREGNSHPYILNYAGMRPCPIATSTHAQRMVAPWLARITGKSKQEVYQTMRQGSWN